GTASTGSRSPSPTSSRAARRARSAASPSAAWPTARSCPGHPDGRGPRGRVAREPPRRNPRHRMPELPFAKGQALGNDYLVLDAADLPWPLEPHRIRLLCDRHRGIGSDGILLGFLDERPICLRIYSPDGSEAEKSGNGLRIFAAYLHGRGIVRDEPFAVALPKDTVEMRVESTLPDGQLMIAVDIGTPSFRGADVGFGPEPGEALGVELDLGEAGVARVITVSLGNPHCVVFVDELD